MAAPVSVAALQDLEVKREQANAEAEKHRRRRDELNLGTREWVERRDELNAKVNDLKRTKAPRGGVPIARLKREARELEFRQQTSVLTPGEEKALIEGMARLQAEIRKREKELEQDEEVRKGLEELRAAKDTAEAAHKQVGGEADAAQEEFIKTKMLADEEHKRHIEFIREVHDYDKIIHGIRQKGSKEPEALDLMSSKRQSEIIFERFRKGEKL